MRNSMQYSLILFQGTTVVLSAYGNGLTEKFTGGKGLSQRGASIRDTALLMSLMVHQAAECGRLNLYSAKNLDITDQLPGKDLLANVEWVKGDDNINKRIGAFSPRCNERGDLPVLQKLITEGTFVDNIIIFHGGEVIDNEESDQLYSLIERLRQTVNPSMLFARINICGKPNLSQLAKGLDVDDHTKSPNNLEISGFSDSVLQLLVARGSGDQLAR